MNRALVDPIADAVLFEGYILYPYRPSVKNRRRWTFGGLYPETFADDASGGADRSSFQAECLVRGSPETTIEAVVRFLHLTARQAGEVVPPVSPAQARGGEVPPFLPVETLRVGEKIYPSWQEAEPREVVLEATTLAALRDGPSRRPFAFPGGRKWEWVRGPDGEVAGLLVRDQQALAGELGLTATAVAEDLFRLTLRVANRTPMECAKGTGDGRDEALLRCLASSHAILGADRGEFISLMDPPDRCREAAAACRNLGTWPVLAGEEGRGDTMLASPIILYDYPQIAPETRTDFFDGTEIDEMLTLRVLTMTDDEKAVMAAVDERARALLERVEGQGGEHRLGLHGAIRGLRAVPEAEG